MIYQVNFEFYCSASCARVSETLYIETENTLAPQIIAAKHSIYHNLDIWELVSAGTKEIKVIKDDRGEKG